MLTTSGIKYLIPGFISINLKVRTVNLRTAPFMTGTDQTLLFRYKRMSLIIVKFDTSITSGYQFWT